MPHVNINDIKLYYEQHGNGPDLILIGGLTADHQAWKSSVRLLSPDFRLLIFDNRGAGQSDAPDYPYTIEMMADDTLQLMNALSISHAHILGHSMGGAIAQQIALTSPEKIDKLILVSTRAKISAIGEMLFNMREKLQAFGMPDDLLAEYVMPFLFNEKFLQNKTNVKGFLHWTLQNPFPQSSLGFKHQFHASRTRDFTDQLCAISLSTLIIVGTEDILVPMDYAKNFSTLFKNSTLQTMFNCAHMPHVENSHLLAQIIIKFLK